VHTLFEREGVNGEGELKKKKRLETSPGLDFFIKADIFHYHKLYQPATEENGKGC
jgi:hypothetical protein